MATGKHDLDNNKSNSYLETDLNAINFAKWLQHTDNGDWHYNPFTKELTNSIGFSPSDCLEDGIYTIEELYVKYKILNK